MSREPILTNPTGEKDEDRALRPKRMREMVGQREVYARIEIAVDAASKRGEPLGHILFDGPPGLGQNHFRNLHSSRTGCKRANRQRRHACRA